MNQPQFNPFTRRPHEITASDLSVLRAVHEGWYIEYKREVPNASSIAKSIAAFSNTYGGWIFYGVAEESKENSVAGEFIGIPTEKAEASLMTIRQAAAHHINPTPEFDVVQINGPCLDINLEEGRTIICISVPESFNTPHIHKSGMIYRRVGDGSEPKPENDRFTLDKLFEKQKSAKEILKKAINRKLHLRSSEKENSFLRIFIRPSIFNESRPPKPVEISHIRKILAPNPIEKNKTLHFDTVHEIGNKFIARQCKNNDPQKKNLTWIIDKKLNSEIIIPINSYRGETSFLRDIPTGYTHWKNFITELESQSYKRADILDATIICLIIFGIIQLQDIIQKEFDAIPDMNIKAQAINCLHMTPFVDVDSFIDECKKYGIPYLENKKTTYPSYPSEFWKIPHTFQDELEEQPSKEETNKKYGLGDKALLAFYSVSQVLGIPFIIEDETNIYNQAIEAAERAMNTQKIQLTPKN